MNQLTLDNDLRASAEKIRNLVKTTVAAVVEAGNELILVKERIGHGNFKIWIGTEFGFSHSTALNYMRAAEFAKTKSATVALLNPRSVYMLAAPSAPAAAVEQVEAKLLAGEKLSERDIADALEVARFNILQAEAAEKRKHKEAKLSAKKRKEREEWKRQDEIRRFQEAERIANAVETLVTALGLEHCKLILELSDGGLDWWSLREALAARIGGAA